MIVNQFRVWARTAPASGRADGASALARACLYSNLDPDQYADAVRALTSLLDDPSALVRRALAEAFAGAIEAPHHIVLALAEDQSSIASIVLARSPVLTDAELIDCAATSDVIGQSAIAGRADLSSPVAAALAEIGAPEALVVLAANHAVMLPTFSIRRMIARHGETAELREALLARPDLPTCLRIDLVAATARALASFVAGCNWMSDERIVRVAREAKERAAIVISEANGGRGGSLELVAHLRQAGQLTVGFIFRAILSGKVDLFRAALADLSGMPLLRVDGLTNNFESTGFAALYRKADLPPDLLPAFRIALRAVRETDWTLAHGPVMSRAVIERVLSGCEALDCPDLDRLMVLLRRFESEAARDEARDVSAPADRAGPLTLTAGGHHDEPLMLTDLDAMDEARPSPHAIVPVTARIEPRLFEGDAIATELCAA